MNDEETFFIADLGERREIFINGQTEKIPRYVVWNKAATKIVEQSDDLSYLLDKYRLSRIHVLKYRRIE
ncbi:hypothetical protein [Oxalobacter paraformigenes]|uniref:Uncharacterized protein n=1 Tax=Oxalobacter paraformigenes TaxID=556268 RepID=C3X3V7_9BURK|nr:hypothetical protein [Oxalobacter paraformigenes]EEO27893.1 hypothetical protein OFAG_01046 [Oxalobacter paraformigenes]